MKFQQKPWKHDPRSRRFSHHKFFGTTPLSKLPFKLDRDPGPVFDQQMTLRCTGYGNAAQAYFIHGFQGHPDWQAAKVGQKQGRSVDEYGGDPNACMKSMRDDGFLPATASPLRLETHGPNGTSWRSFQPHLDDIARKHDTAVGFFKVDGPYDTFNNIKSVLFKAFDPVTKRGQAVDVFGRWMHPWTDAPGGVIDPKPSFGAAPPKRSLWHRILSYFFPNFGAFDPDFAGYHRYIFYGWDGDYLLLKNSYGSSRHLYRMHRDVVNFEFKQPNTTLKILKLATPEQIAEAKKATPLGRLWDAVLTMWWTLSEKYGLRPL